MKMLETTVSSSWMVVIFAMPVFLAYAVVFRAGIGYLRQLAGVLIPFLLIPASAAILMGRFIGLSCFVSQEINCYLKRKSSL
ncbi:MAG: hypothetical protein H8E73_03815 [Planctomycetes bacterium]|nr:hypothetical protein [Planctomycetota bacterium]